MSDLGSELRALGALLANQDSWIKDYLAMTPTGLAVTPKSPSANCWCLLGGCERVSPDPTHLINYLCRIKAQVADHAEARVALASFNDDPYTEHSDILTLINNAIAAYEAEHGGV